MADPTDQDKVSKEPNLELPSLSLRRKKRKKKDKPPKDTPAKDTPAKDAARVESETATTAPVPSAATARATPREPSTAPPQPAAASTPEPTPPPAPTPPPPTRPVLPAPPEPSTAASSARAPRQTPAARAPELVVPDAKIALEPSSSDTASEATREPRPSRVRAGWAVTRAGLERFDDRIDTLAFKKIPGHLAAIITGIVCGIVSVLLSWLAASGCDAVRGVGTCGSFGVVALVAIIAIDVLVGGILLRAWGVNDPVSTALLGVGLVAVFVMLFLLPSVGSIWMALVIPLLTALMFLLSWWVTAKIVEADE